MKAKSATKGSDKALTLSQQELVIKHYPLVQKIVNSIKSHLPAHADLDELHSAGISGLVDASMRLNPDRRETFGAYAAMRIRGAIMDELRKLDYMPRSARQDAKRLNRAREDLESKLGRTATEDELRKSLSLSQKQYNRILRRTQNIAFVSINDEASNDGETRNLCEIIPDESASSAVEDIEKQELYTLLKQRILNISEKQRRIIECYYFKGQKLAEIAKSFGVSEARVCQIHAQALKILKAKFRN